AQLAMYKSLLPTLQVLGVIYDPEKTGALVKEAGEVAGKFGLRFLATPVASQTEVPAALRSLLGKVDALWLLPDDTVVTPESLTDVFSLTPRSRAVWAIGWSDSTASFTARSLNAAGYFLVVDWLIEHTSYDA